ncbi:hypothetical protein C8R45DRAFT_141873 [Mycena sanguinolenta]|nr:hypothetical protein C8R45DRAFT_141873 [Mycena sanguinolenta]
MSPTSSEPRSRALHIVRHYCFNQNGQAVACPITRGEVIGLGILIGILAILGLVWCICKCGCNCSCRRRRQKTYITTTRAPDLEAQAIVLPRYKQFESSAESLTPPASPPYYKPSDHLSTGYYGYLEQPSTETLVEPPKMIHPAVHIYPTS